MSTVNQQLGSITVILSLTLAAVVLSILCVRGLGFVRSWGGMGGEAGHCKCSAVDGQLTGRP